MVNWSRWFVKLFRYNTILWRTDGRTASDNTLRAPGCLLFNSQRNLLVLGCTIAVTRNCSTDVLITHWIRSVMMHSMLLYFAGQHSCVLSYRNHVLYRRITAWILYVKQRLHSVSPAPFYARRGWCILSWTRWTTGNYCRPQRSGKYGNSSALFWR